MKLRIIEVFDATIMPWFRLEQWKNERWEFINGDRSCKSLERQAEKILACPSPRVAKEFSDEVEDLVDNGGTTGA